MSNQTFNFLPREMSPLRSPKKGGSQPVSSARRGHKRPTSAIDLCDQDHTDHKGLSLFVHAETCGLEGTLNPEPLRKDKNRIDPDNVEVVTIGQPQSAVVEKLGGRGTFLQAPAGAYGAGVVQNLLV